MESDMLALDADAIKKRFKKRLEYLRTLLGAMRRSGSGRAWWIVDSSSSAAKDNHPKALCISQQLGFDRVSMVKAFGKRWRGKFTKILDISAFFAGRVGIRHILYQCGDHESLDSNENSQCGMLSKRVKKKAELIQRQLRICNQVPSQTNGNDTAARTTRRTQKTMDTPGKNPNAIGNSITPIHNSNNNNMVSKSTKRKAEKLHRNVLGILIQMTLQQ
mmetsp:Transcript_30720/g.56929  ORF Transcript_30720/g.56929 Transcript_30720/m.56929 type:complete len:218 (-) Transcript_30720:281-934(-)